MAKALVFTRDIAIDDKYMFTVTDKVENKGDKPVSLRPYALILRRGTPKSSGYSPCTKALSAMATAPVQEVTYAGIDKETDRLKPMKCDRRLVRLHRPILGLGHRAGADRSRSTRASRLPARRRARIIRPISSPRAIDVAPGATASHQTHIFAGANEVSTIDAYISGLDIKKFDLMIDWGRLYFITKPMFYLIDFIYKYVGNFGLAILSVTVIVKALFFPLANQSYRSMAKMKVIQPKLAALKEQYPNDSQKQQQAQMELMRKEGVNPVAGCLPMLPQIPVFFALYKRVLDHLEMRHAPFFGWIKDLSAPDPTNVFTLFGLIPFDPTVLPDVRPLPASGSLAAGHGLDDVLADEDAAGADRPDAEDDVHVYAGHLHLYVRLAAGRPRHLLCLEQLADDFAAIVDHETGGHPDRAVRQSAPDVRQAGGLNPARKDWTFSPTRRQDRRTDGKERDLAANSDFPFAAGVAVVTGAASGIGAALAAELAGRGAALALVDIDGRRP